MKTNATVNDVAKIEFAIRSKYQEHWYAGLRQAELEKERIIQSLKDLGWQYQLKKRLGCPVSPVERDLRSQLAVVERLESEFLAAHRDELEGKSYEQLQGQYASESLNARKVYAIAQSALSSRLGISPGAAELLLQSAPEDRPKLIQQAFELSGFVSRDAVLALISTLPEIDQETIRLNLQQRSLTSQYTYLLSQNHDNLAE